MGRFGTTTMHDAYGTSPVVAAVARSFATPTWLPWAALAGAVALLVGLVVLLLVLVRRGYWPNR